MARTTLAYLDDEKLQIRVGTDGVIRHWGAALQAVYGYTSEEAVGRSVELVIPPVLRAWHWKGFDRALDVGHLKHPGRRARVPAVHKDGTIVEVRAWPSLALGADGKVEAVVSSGAMRGSAVSGPIWRAVLAAIGAGQTVRSSAARRRAARPSA